MSHDHQQHGENIQEWDESTSGALSLRTSSSSSLAIDDEGIQLHPIRRLRVIPTESSLDDTSNPFAQETNQDGVADDNDTADDNDPLGFRMNGNYRSIRLSTSDREPWHARSSTVVVRVNPLSGTSLVENEEPEEEREEPFTFLPPELEPKIPPKQKERAKKAMKQVAALTFTETEEDEEKEECCERLKCWPKKKLKEEKKPVVKPTPKKEEVIVPSTEITPEMQKASNQGLNMVKGIIFPALPAITQDLWVYLELTISIVAFAIGVVDIFSNDDPGAFNYAYFVLATVSMALAFVDSFIYFFQLGSCARVIRACSRKLKKMKKRRQQSDLETLDLDDFEEMDDDGDESGPRKCYQLNDKWKQHFSTWFELGRNILTELIMYPLLVFDLFAFIIEQAYNPEGDLGRADFSLFVIGGFYLILSVYFMRIFMVAGSVISLIRMPSNQDASDSSDNTPLLIKFCIHVLGQILVHLMVILVIGAKIQNENRDMPECDEIGSALMSNLSQSFNTTNRIGNNVTSENTGWIGSAMMLLESMDDGSAIATMPGSTDFSGSGSGLMPESDSDDDDGDIKASPFLITAIVLGGMLPLAGVLAFFAVNYYWMKEFSIGFWLNMISLLKGESFAEAVFGGEGASASKEKALKFVEKSQYKKVKKQLKQFKAPPIWKKFLFPACVPRAAIGGLLYYTILVAFIACLMLKYDCKNEVIELAVFTDDDIMTAVFVIAILMIIMANIHLLVLFNLILLMVAVVLAFAAAVILAVRYAFDSTDL